MPDPTLTPISPVALREAIGLSQAAAAAELGVHRRTLDRYERREQEPTASVLDAMARLYMLPAHLMAQFVGYWRASC